MRGVYRKSNMECIEKEELGLVPGFISWSCFTGQNGIVESNKRFSHCPPARADALVQIEYPKLGIKN